MGGTWFGRQITLFEKFLALMGSAFGLRLQVSVKTPLLPCIFLGFIKNYVIDGKTYFEAKFLPFFSLYTSPSILRALKVGHKTNF